MSEKCQNVFEEMSMLVPSARFENGKFRFPVYINERLSKASIDELDLSVRSSNCLHRAGYQTIGQLVESIEGFEDLKRIRNCGAKSVNEIMEKLFCYQYCQLDTQQKRKYIQKVVEYNKGY